MGDLIELVINSLGLPRQQLQFLTRAAWVVFVSFHILWVCGWLTAFGLSVPFANAQEVQQRNLTLQQAMTTLLDGQMHKLDYDIFQLRVQQCHAPEDKRDQYAARLQELITEYSKLTKQYPRVPPCDEL